MLAGNSNKKYPLAGNLKEKKNYLQSGKRYLVVVYRCGYPQMFGTAKKNDAGSIRSLLTKRISWTRSSDWLALFLFSVLKMGRAR